jgi:N-acetylmuramoyl-L-alanine amidase
MSDDNTSTRKPFGERSEAERQLPFGARPPRELGARSAASYDAPVPIRESEPLADFSVPIEQPIRAAAPRLEVAEVLVERIRPVHHAPEPTLTAPNVSPRYLLMAVPAVLVVAAVIGGVALRSNKSVEASHDADITSISTALPATPTATPLVDAGITPDPAKRIGIASGHRGINPENGLPDPGTVCEDGTTEQHTVEVISFKVADLLTKEGYTVDVLDKWDARLPGYSALAFVSIHADSCDYINDLATGYKVAGWMNSPIPEASARLVGCITDRYAETTGLPFHADSITEDMTDNYVFRLIAPEVPSAIIEVGFLYLDKEILTEHPDDAAAGIAQGILCYLSGE